MIPVPGHIVSRFLTQAALIKVTLARKHGLKPFEFLALTLVGENEDVPMKELRAGFCASSSTLTLTVDSLERRGLLKRRRGEQDRRQWSLFLSAKGKKLYYRMMEAESNLVMSAFEGLTDAETAAIVRVAEEMSHTARPS